MKDNKFIFSSDIHGNEIQLSKLFKFALKNKIFNIVLGGDLCPKDIAHRTVLDQGIFLNKLITLAKEHSKIKVYLILGNDDFRANEFIVKENRYITYINLKKTKFIKGFYILGCSFIPPTPFKFKDWEIWDTQNKQEDTLRGNFITKGITSLKEKFIDFDFNVLSHKKNIYSLLIKNTKNINFNKTIFVIHTPPYKTNIDICKTKEHVGSLGVRKFIEEKQPLLSLHGHIHEACEMSSTYYDVLKKTLVINSCNDYLNDNVALVVIEINKKIKHTRLLI